MKPFLLFYFFVDRMPDGLLLLRKMNGIVCEAITVAKETTVTLIPE
jgi:hypothetical protein